MIEIGWFDDIPTVQARWKTLDLCSLCNTGLHHVLKIRAGAERAERMFRIFTTQLSLYSLSHKHPCICSPFPMLTYALVVIFLQAAGQLV